MIYYNLEESPYIYKIGDFMFYFSSSLTRKKFIKNYLEYIKDRNSRLQYYYRCKCDFTNMLLVSFYKRIESRGFFILFKGNKLQEYKFTINLEV